jgi:hypothetical protein
MLKISFGMHTSLGAQHELAESAGKRGKWLGESVARKKKERCRRTPEGQSGHVLSQHQEMVIINNETCK